MEDEINLRRGWDFLLNCTGLGNEIAFGMAYLQLTEIGCASVWLVFCIACWVQRLCPSSGFMIYGYNYTDI
jgi:hypothetical protein